MALDVGARGYGILVSAAATIPTDAFSPSPGNPLCGIARHLPETNAVVTAAADTESGNTYDLVGSATTDSNGYVAQKIRSSAGVNISGSMQVSATLVGGATNNAEAGSYIVMQEITGGASFDKAGGQAQALSTTGDDVATTGALGTPAAANNIVVGFFTHNSWPDVLTAGTGYTEVFHNNDLPNWLITKLVQSAATAATATADCDLTGSMNNHGFIYIEAPTSWAVNAADGAIVGDTPSGSYSASPPIQVSAADGVVVGDSPGGSFALVWAVSAADGVVVGESAPIVGYIVELPDEGVIVGDTPSATYFTPTQVIAADGVIVGDNPGSFYIAPPAAVSAADGVVLGELPGAVYIAPGAGGGIGPKWAWWWLRRRGRR